MRALAPILAAMTLPLSACSRQGNGTSVTINTSNGNTALATDGTSGEVKLAVPGFDGKFTLPKLQVAADDFDLNGVHLYPGTTIRSLNIDAAKHGDGKDNGVVRVAFTSPAGPATVRDWLMARLNKAGFKVAAAGDGLAGRTDEGKPFALRLTPAAGGKAADGTIAIGG